MQDNDESLSISIEIQGSIAIVRTLVESPDAYIDIVEEVLPGKTFYTVSHAQLIEAGSGIFTLKDGKLLPG
jgi:hypothetical protein